MKVIEDVEMEKTTLRIFGVLLLTKEIWNDVRIWIGFCHNCPLFRPKPLSQNNRRSYPITVVGKVVY